MTTESSFRCIENSPVYFDISKISGRDIVELWGRHINTRKIHMGIITHNKPRICEVIRYGTTEMMRYYTDVYTNPITCGTHMFKCYSVDHTTEHPYIDISALDYAILHKRICMIEFLIRELEFTGMSLMCAVASEDLSLVKYIVKQGAPHKIWALSAAAAHSTAIYNYLVTIINDNGTGILFATIANNIELVKQLYVYNRNHHITILQIAQKYGYVGIITFLDQCNLSALLNVIKLPPIADSTIGTPEYIGSEDSRESYESTYYINPITPLESDEPYESIDSMCSLNSQESIDSIDTYFN